MALDVCVFNVVSTLPETLPGGVVDPVIWLPPELSVQKVYPVTVPELPAPVMVVVAPEQIAAGVVQLGVPGALQDPLHLILKLSIPIPCPLVLPAKPVNVHLK